VNGSIRETVRSVETVRLTYTNDGAYSIDRKELGILIKRGEALFEVRLGRKPECDNDWWLEWGDEEIAFCFTVTTDRPATAPEPAP